jgi:NCS1 family nucleobase:cation symporter-1
MATVGVDYGIPGQVATRAIYGLRGSKVIPSFLRSIASCYWFAFQTVIGATAICAVLEKLTGTSFSLILVSVLFGIVQAVVAIVGYDSLKALSRVALPVKLAMFVYLFVLLANQTDPNFAPSAVLSFPGQERLELGDLRCLVQCGGRWLADDDHRLGRFLPLFA